MKEYQIKTIKPVKICDIVLIVIICISAVFMMFFRDYEDKSSVTAVITKDNKIIHSIELSTLEKPREIVIEGDIPLTVLLENDGVSVVHSECNDKICEKTGKLTYTGGAIVCLPAKVSIRLESPDKEIDAVVR